MKAEHRKQLEKNELADRLGHTWQALTSESASSKLTIVLAVVLFAAVVILGWRYYARTTSEGRSAMWVAVDFATDEDRLRTIIKEHPGSEAARIARFHLARAEMQDALSRLASPNSEERRKAGDRLQEVRSQYAELAKEVTDEPVLVQEALMGVAKADEVLASVPKADNDNEMRGSLEQALASYQDLAKRYPDTFLGKEAAQRAKELSEHATQVKAFYIALSKEHGKPEPPPPAPVPPLPPLTPPTPPAGTQLPEAPRAPAVKPDEGPKVPTPPPAAAATPTPPAGTPVAPPAGVTPQQAPKQEPKPPEGKGLGR